MDSAFLDRVPSHPRNGHSPICGVYYIFNVVNGKFYVGSSQNVIVRFKCHRRLLRHGTHHSAPLQKAWDKYGEDSFRFLIALPTDTAAVARQFEQCLVSQQPAYNVATSVDITGWASQPKSPEHRKKIADALRGKAKSREAVEKQRRTVIGRKRPECSKETRAKLSVANKGHVPWIKGKQQSVLHHARIQVARQRYWANKLGRQWPDIIL